MKSKKLLLRLFSIIVLLTSLTIEALGQAGTGGAFILGDSKAADMYRTTPRSTPIATPDTRTENSNFGNSSDEISIFDHNGSAKAYIADDLTIYLWNGEPVAYLYQSNGHWHVYGFNGGHLGWYENGIIYENNGDPVGAQKGATYMVTSVEPVKDVKNVKPVKGVMEVAPVKPIFSNSWAQTPLVIFLRAGEN